MNEKMLTEFVFNQQRLRRAIRPARAERERVRSYSRVGGEG